MELHRITRIDDPRFADLHALLRRVFPPEEVLAFDEWAEPLADEGLRVVVAVESLARQADARSLLDRAARRTSRLVAPPLWSLEGLGSEGGLYQSLQARGAACGSQGSCVAAATSYKIKLGRPPWQRLPRWGLGAG
ncbi:MAG: hypothetical protein K6T26_08620 [Alicyclobacillus sp.]|nr:hypothetical protein [Alicyclobacillus sp.]